VSVELPEPLTPQEHRRLVGIIERVAPKLLPLARDGVNARWLANEECEALVSALLGVFLDSLDRNDGRLARGLKPTASSVVKAGRKCTP